MRKATRNSLNT